MHPRGDALATGGLEPRISVVIATRNRPTELLAAIASILDGTEQRLEIVVVDQSDTDAAAMAVDGVYGRDGRVRVVRDEGRGAARARNIGVGAARAGIAAITDDDCVVSRTWIADVLDAFERHPDVDMVFGSVVAPPHDYAREVIPQLLLSRRDRRIERGLRGRACRMQGISANMAVRREVFVELGGFDPGFGVGSARWSAEDVELHYRALREGRCVLIEPVIGVWHLGKRTTEEAWDLWRRDALGCGAAMARFVGEGHPVVGAHMWWWYIGRLVWRGIVHTALLRFPTGLRLGLWMARHSVGGFRFEWGAARGSGQRAVARELV